MASVTFLNHSCIRVESGATSILCDPWFTGSAFDDGWRLLVEDSHNLADIDYDWLWLSHEHPDHFSIPTLKQIGKRAQVIYQTTDDKKVKAYLGKQNDVTEIDNFEIRRCGDIDCQLFISDGYDSAMLFRLPSGHTVLNINDCRVELGGLVERIAAATGTLDLLAAQFSYANWAGNAGDRAIPAYQHEQVMRRLERAIDVLKPKALLLFASYVYFSHEENFYWNEHFWLSQAVARLSAKVRVIVPHPDAVLDLGELDADLTAQNAEAVRFWTSQHATRRPVDQRKARPPLSELAAQYAAFHEALWRDNDLDYARATSRGPLDLVVRLDDQNTTVRLELFSGEFVIAPGEDYDVALSSETLAMLFRNKFGRGTVTINGRVQFNYGRAYKFFAFFFAFYSNNIGKRMAPDGLSWSALRSIENTSVLDSIFSTTPEARTVCRAWLDGFIAS